jgi:myo-inositol 2-dehydrogenase / D-chiro-inositol 1-dehydrogenase
MNIEGLTYAVIGAGRMGLRHIEAARKLGMKVVGVSDVSADAVHNACQTHQLNPSAGFSDAAAMLAATRPQAVAVATTAPSHCELVLQAVHHGARYVLCEKPMASSLEEADRMITACQEHGVTLAVNHQMRFMPQYTRIKALVDTDRMGPLVSILVAGSNFGLAMNASHYFEMFRYMSGSEIETLQAWFEPHQLANPRGPQFEDRSGKVLARAASGVSMFVDFSAGAGHGLQCVYICRNGQITVDELTGDVRVAARQAQYRELPTTRYGMPADIENLSIEPADTVVPTMEVWQALLTGAPFPEGRTAGLHALTCLVAAHESHLRGGLPVALRDAQLARDQRFPWA